MSYYRPEIYNYENLKESDKNLIKFMLETTRCALNNAYYGDEYCSDDGSTLSKIRMEERKSALKDAWEQYQYSIVDLIVSTIDDYEDEVPELKTDNYFYGCDVEDLFEEE